MIRYLVEIQGRRVEIGVSRHSATEALVELDGRRQRVELRQFGQSYTLLLEGRTIDLAIAGRDGFFRIQLAGQEYEVHVERALLQKYRQYLQRTPDAAQAVEAIRAPMPGLLLKVAVQPGQAVKAGDLLAVIDAMKMENEIRAPRDGLIEIVNVREKAQIEKGQLLCTLRQTGGEP